MNIKLYAYQNKKYYVLIYAREIWVYLIWAKKGKQKTILGFDSIHV